MSGAGSLTVRSLLRDATEKLKAASVDGAARDARMLLAHVLDRGAGDLIAMGNEPVSSEIADSFHAAINRRLDRMPVHRIIGSREFYGRNFFLNEACLEPRPETELLVECVLARHSKEQALRFCDVGTGSGVIAVTLLAELPMTQGVATDISALALKAAKTNAGAHGVHNRLKAMHCDCLEGVSGLFDFIVSNPPYIPTVELAYLSREVRDHDPVVALDGGADGMIVYRKLLAEAQPLLEEDGLLYLETGHKQHHELCLLAEQMGWGIVECLLDLSSLERIVVLQR